MRARPSPRYTPPTTRLMRFGLRHRRTRWWSKATWSSPRCPTASPRSLAAQCDAMGKAFIDMGADFRLENEADYQEWYGGAYQDKVLHEKAVYGLPEFFREKIRGKKVIANPGCYTTGGAAWPWRPPWRPGLIEGDGHHRRLQIRRDRRGAQAHPGQPLPGAQRELYCLQGGGPPPHPGD